ncbi:restriction endonuclease [Vibrio fluvialis]|nr:restriction endonuclease [Vibrio fluvialis]MBY7806847.1 restriction endonuclease [Vibrio fluvialis]MBY7944655.1 restriction endonuclease [Vibrio fluvialis]
MTNSFMHQLVDWKGFELFVRDLYSSFDDLVVEHDVTELGKSGATRQIDVKVTQRSALHEIVTLIECKYWKKPIERTTIDIVAASLDDLNASKAVVFTTVGYQQGAEAYAKSKNIDIFVVRDLLEEEWGKPGRNIEMYLNIVSGEFGTLGFPEASALLIVEEQPEDMDLSLELSKDKVGDPKFQLFSVKNGETGPNFIEILTRLHQYLNMGANDVLGQNNEYLDKYLTFEMDVTLDLSEYEFRQVRNQYAAVNFSKMVFSFSSQINRSLLEIDRAKNLDYALVVQDYLTSQSHIVTKDKNGLVRLMPQTGSNSGGNEHLVNGSTYQIYCQPWVGVDASKTNVKAKLNVPLNLQLVQDEEVKFKFVQTTS